MAQAGHHAAVGTQIDAEHLRTAQGRERIGVLLDGGAAEEQSRLAGCHLEQLVVAADVDRAAGAYGNVRGAGETDGAPVGVVRPEDTATPSTSPGVGV